MSNITTVKDLLHGLQELVPQYILGCFPVLAILASTPQDGLMSKILCLLRCIACPFTGLLYFVNIGSGSEDITVFWLNADDFVIKKDLKREDNKDDVENKDEWETLNFRPFGHHAMKTLLTAEQKQQLDECVAEASILERLSSLASAYYIFVGIFSGIYRAVGPCSIGDWPYIPLALAWTLPVVYRRVTGGKMVFINPKRKLLDKIIVEPLDQNEASSSSAHVTITAIASIIVPWIVVILAYYTPPLNYGCRSKFLSVLCVVWTVNNFIAYILHVKGEKYVTGNRYIHSAFALCGVLVVGFFIVLVVLGGKPEWWVIMGESCLKTCQ
jgi:hypothetical protein